MKGSLVVVALCSLIAGCGPKATPVTPAPLSAEQQAQLGQTLRGTWRSTHIKVGDGSKKEEDSFEFAFDGSGKMRTVIHSGFGNIANDWTCTMDGRNLKTNSMFGTMRADE